MHVCGCVCVKCIYGIRKGPRRREISSKGKTFIDLLRSLSFCLSHFIYLSHSRTHTRTSTHTLPLSLYFFLLFSVFLTFSLSLSCPRVSSIFIHTRHTGGPFTIIPLPPRQTTLARFPSTFHKPSLHAEPHNTTICIYICVYTPQAFPLPDLPPRWPVSISRIKSYPLRSDPIAILRCTLLRCSDRLYPVHTPYVYMYLFGREVLRIFRRHHKAKSL